MMFTRQRAETCWKAENAALQPRCGGPQTAVQHMGLFTVSLDAAKVSVGRGQVCKYVTLGKESSMLAHAALHNLDKGASVGSEVYFLLNLPCFFDP